MEIPRLRDNNGTFKIEEHGETLIITPTIALGELEYDRIVSGARVALDQLAAKHSKNVVLDLANSDYSGSLALGFFVRLWKKVRQAGGRMVLCNVSNHEREILQVTRLDGLWDMYGSRDEALAAIASG